MMTQTFSVRAAARISAVTLMLAAVPATASEPDDLAKAAQNPVANMISLPLQNNTLFDVGPGEATVNVLNIQPVIPFSLSEDWNVITRTILPFVIQGPVVDGIGTKAGLGDTTLTAFLSPAGGSSLIWGVGPVAVLPTSTDDRLGAGEWGGGISGVVLTMRGPVVAGTLVNNVWSFEGSGNNLLLQPFVNYNLDDGWYLVSSPIITADWEASGGERWTVPVGSGFGRVFSIGSQPVNASFQGFYNVEKPEFGADWSLRFQLQFLFPR
jgi:hypothetical protein